jgi:hypothetical protein
MHSSIFVGMSAALAQPQAQTQAKTPPEPPLFQGIMVDAKGKNVGRIYFLPNGYTGFIFVVRQINGLLALPVTDFSSGFAIIPPGTPGGFTYWYQSVDCTGQAYIYVDQNQNQTAPVIPAVLAIPPATAPSIYFAGTPATMVTIKSFRYGPSFDAGTGGSCIPLGSNNQGPFTAYMGPIQSYQ